jgi:hypothetical protein
MSEFRESQDGPLSLRQLDVALHEMSQPITVLLCSLEFGADLESVSEMESVMRAALLECERLRRTVVQLQDRVRDFGRDSRLDTKELGG